MKLKNSGILKDAVIYLSGPMQFAKDDGIGWRQKFIDLTKDLGIKIIDPTNKPSSLGVECKEEKGKVQRLKEEEKWDELTEYAKTFVRFDCRAVDLSDAIVIYLDPNIFTVGTIQELLIAENQQKPLFIIMEGGKKAGSAWLFGIVDHKNMFDSVEQCVEHFNKLNNGDIKLNDNWVLIRDYLNKKE